MARSVTKAAGEFERIASSEHNVAHGVVEQFGPSKRFTQKGQQSNASQGGGINRSLKGKGSSSKSYTGSAQ